MRRILTAVITVIYAALLAWQHLHDGVPSHHLLAQEALPSLSNWWGLLVLPVLTWLTLGRVQRRRATSSSSSFDRSAFIGFIVAMLFGALLSVFFASGKTAFTEAMLPALALIALCYPIYRAECLLGFVIGMTYTFGPVLPILAGSIFAFIGAVLFHVPRLIVSQFARRSLR